MTPHVLLTMLDTGSCTARSSVIVSHPDVTVLPTHCPDTLRWASRL
jgi:hypothetical protein